MTTAHPRQTPRQKKRPKRQKKKMKTNKTNKTKMKRKTNCPRQRKGTQRERRQNVLWGSDLLFFFFSSLRSR